MEEEKKQVELEGNQAMPTEEEIKKELGQDRELKNTIFDRFLLTSTAIIFLIMITLVMSQVIIRYLTSYFGITLHWTEEVARYIMVVVAFLGSAVAWRKRENISISMFIDMLPLKIRVPLDLFKDFTIFCFALFLVYGSYMMSVKMSYSPLGTLMQFKLGQIYFILAIVFTIVAIYLFRWLVQGVLDLKNIYFDKASPKEGVDS